MVVYATLIGDTIACNCAQCEDLCRSFVIIVSICFYAVINNIQAENTRSYCTHVENRTRFSGVTSERYNHFLNVLRDVVHKGFVSEDST